MITNIRNLFKLFVLLNLFLSSVSMSYATIPNMPFSKGTTWVYEGIVKWQENTEVKSKRITLKSEILEAFRHQDIRIAVVRGFPTELAWYSDKTHPKCSLLVLSQEGLLEIETDSERDARRMAQDFASQSHELMKRASVIMPFPLSQGRRFHLRVKGFRALKATMSYRDIYQTNPDHTIVDFVPSLGVVHYIYEHHGTVSSVDVTLKEIRHGEAIIAGESFVLSTIAFSCLV